MKSTVEITAIPSETRYTAASSFFSKPTSRFESLDAGIPRKASDRTVGPILAAQPQVLASPVRVFFLPKFNMSVLLSRRLFGKVPANEIGRHHYNTDCDDLPYLKYRLRQSVYTLEQEGIRPERSTFGRSYATWNAHAVHDVCSRSGHHIVPGFSLRHSLSDIPCADALLLERSFPKQLDFQSEGFE